MFFGWLLVSALALTGLSCFDFWKETHSAVGPVFHQTNVPNMSQRCSSRH